MDEQIVFYNGYNATKNSACSKCLKKNLGAISILKGGRNPLAPSSYYTLLLRTWCVALSKHSTHYDPRSRFSYLQSDNPLIETPHPLIRHPVTRWVFLWVWSPETFEPVPREYLLFVRGTKTELLHKYLKVKPKFEVCTTGEKIKGGGKVLIPVWKQ